MLLKYFGEKKTTPCKQCDYCVRHKEREISKADWDKVVEEALNTSDIEIISQKTGISEHKVIEILRQAKDSE